MTDDRIRLIELLVKTIPELTAGQLQWLQRVVQVFSADHVFRLSESNIFDETTLQNFGDAIRVHHSFSSEPFSKDKFEYVLVKVLKMSGHTATLAPKGNPGHDATTNGVKLSLKTQADKGIKEDILWISKFMELGKGNWGDNPADLIGLRQQFLEHLKAYDRILTLRTLSKAPKWKYELVEIPKRFLMKAGEGDLKMMEDSKQYPKPGYCYVRNNVGELLFELYFDGGSERKLQIKNLSKSYCSVHATWEFVIPSE
jgi:type II restriction enzyme